MIGVARRQRALRRIHSVIPLSSYYVLTNMPLNTTELGGRTDSRIYVDLTEVTEVRIMCFQSVMGTATSFLTVQYRTVSDATWRALSNSFSFFVGLVAIGNKISAWAPIVRGARGDVILRAVTAGGNGIVDPTIGGLALEVR